jgi:hypothetical protein
MTAFRLLLAVPLGYAWGWLAHKLFNLMGVM